MIQKDGKVIGALLAASVVLAGCSLPGYGGPPANGPQGGGVQPQATASPEAMAASPVNGQNVVTYKDGVFSPGVVKIKAGQTVTFTNEGPGVMWVASNPHPTHTDYPGFDARREYNVGESYSFTFTKVGSWGYHNHRDPGVAGSVEVSE